MSDKPETRYTKSGDVHIAYQVVGNGPLDLVVVPGFVSHVECQWEEPHYANMLRRAASFSRLICFDKRGTGLSDRVTDMPTLEQRMDDVRAVMDAVGSSRAALFGVSEGGPMSILFSATYPKRTTALVLYGSFAKWAWAPDNPWGRTQAEMQQGIETTERDAGGPVGIQAFAPSGARNDAFTRWYANYRRLAASPGAAIAIQRMNYEIDVRHVLPTVRVPTLVLHAIGDRVVLVGHGRYLAERIPGAKLVELPGDDHMPFASEALRHGDAITDEIEEFLTGVRPDHGGDRDRVLATILFTDIVGSTERAAAIGDRRWRETLEQYYAAARRELARFRGREIDTAGDGLFAAFDGPARAIRCACRIRDEVRPLGIEIRSGLHAGECEIVGEKISGIAVHIGARVATNAAPGEVLVSNTVRDLVAGSGIGFKSRGTHVLKGVPGEWPLFVVAGAV
ncbi:MAG TPA: adenylate/guanylate cyclase domain-containing protein [Vicinamibacterales bacterium]|nr:adenylate/guanylate cyclase domain-containing protein [Vicinamibacterales bacterium]